MTMLVQDQQQQQQQQCLLRRIWQQQKQLYGCICIMLIPIIVVNTYFIYSSFILDEDSLFSLHSSSFQAPLNALSHKSPQSNDKSETKECDLSKGNWIPDTQPPLYTNDTCKYIQGHQNCMRNGRPDRGYLNWRWKPNDCDLPQFNPHLFLQLMRNKKMLFLGDSIARNHMQSLLCAISQVEEPKNMYREKDDKDVIWGFPSYNFTVAIFWSPFLIKHTKEIDNVTKQTTMINLYLDVPEEIWAKTLPEYDVAVISTGPWYFKGSIYYTNNSLLGCHHCGSRNLTQVGFTDAYRRALENTFRYIANLKGYKGMTILRTFSVEHFEHGTWDKGGTCNRTNPFLNQTHTLPWMASQMQTIQIEEFHKCFGNGTTTNNGSKAKLFDVTYSAYLRPDGHPGRYRSTETVDSTKPVISDCLHWCLPGPIDMWNQVILEMLRKQKLTTTS